MPKPRAYLLPLLPALALLAAPNVAEACGAPFPELTSTIPATGETYPANAAMLFSGHDISLAEVTVTIDGAPATLVEQPLPGFQLAATIEPNPTPGQTVVVSGDFCDSETCEEEISFIAGPADDSPPEATDVMFAAFDHAPFRSGGGDCMSDSDLTFYMHADASAQAPGQAPVRYLMSLADLEIGGLFEAAGPTARPISVVDQQIAGVVVTDLCLKLEVVDLAGNVGLPVEVCKPCFFRTSDAPEDAMTPPEPAWTDADAVPGSACAGPGETDSDSSGSSSGSDPDTGDATTDEPPTTGEPTGTAGESGETLNTTFDTSDDSGGEDEQKDGCGCRSDAPAGSLGLLAGLLLIARRRR